MDANQARRRTDLDFVPVHEPASTSQAPKAFIYQPLDPDRDADSIRLVLIQPHTNDDDLLCCNLIHVKFAEKRRYNALSYMWGAEAVKVDILLEGALFQVGQNLWDALHYLRSSETQMPFWIDAICINQRDVEERNRQLPMMKWIYFRADTVVTWLGRKYSKYQMSAKVQNNSWATSEITDESWGTLKNGVSEKDRNERALVKELRSDEYWDRLWIIQEIGQARQNLVCFGTSAMAWNAFIEMVTVRESGGDGPLRLNRLVKEKYTGSLTLQTLLQDHRKALCKEPRDKIYGLIGLAADAFQFPMDYNKSLLEVWTDTMVFLNAQGSLDERDIIPFGSLVKSLLIGNNLGPLQQALRPHDPQLDSVYVVGDTESDLVFELQAVVVGCIQAVGPSTDEIISSLRKADDWAGQVQQNFRDELGDAHRENDTLMRYILEFDEARLAAICYGHVSNVRWLDSPGDSRWKINTLNSYIDTIQANQDRYASKLNPNTQASSDDVQTGPAGSSKPFLVRNRARRKTPWKMGIASSLAQPGDLICWVPGIQRALILRASFKQLKKIHKGTILQGFGTALFTDDFDSTDKARHADRLKTFSDCEKLDIQIDAATIYVLLA
ncbi:hypothetical protein NA56DRAFT_704495 [Hyaloscypha hepaticicola]|uniref:Heterokaryon incompatibility domain-containing protein n=1 Tax=Hyaloscypha hepaticicola TaxID=2082293 RepID=A0A2J6Q330_9HELO|nr:hypothetical protein NA56DRAFT_704495 [Hyaloscypha hepaticicola]